RRNRPEAAPSGAGAGAGRAADLLSSSDSAPVAGAPALADVLRVAAAAWRRFRGGRALDAALDEALRDGRAPASPRLGAAAQDAAYTAVRHLALAEAGVARLAAKPPAPAVGALLAVALGQLYAQRHAEYAVVDQAVAAARADAQTAAAAGFVNALLRNALRGGAGLRAELSRDPAVAANAPRWWLDRLRRAYPEQWADLATRAQQAPPLVLRVNRRQITVAAYLDLLRGQGLAATQVGTVAVWLHAPRPVAEIPGFSGGLVSVQDAGAQLAAEWLDLADGMRVLDACAAPGGKTAHLAELAALTLDALEVDPARAARIEPNFARLGLPAHTRLRVLVADGAQPARWAGGSPYDRILLDAPCTASGIVRRHPDIPWLRRAGDIAQFATRQRALLAGLWSLLAPAGRLLYVVCSLFPEEGERQAQAFLAAHPDARLRALPGQRDGMRQLLPSAATPAPWAGGLPALHDGFFFAFFEKRE
ncbi:MAG: 16S rRNA (cytosine(967)-C(5))-methyltransferase RsmB, partial [Betaproteobacteria bacterium]